MGFEDPVGKPVVAHELPDVFDRVEFRGFRRQRQDGDVARNLDGVREMPACLIDEKDGVRSRRDGGGDFRQV